MLPYTPLESETEIGEFINTVALYSFVTELLVRYTEYKFEQFAKAYEYIYEHFGRLMVLRAEQYLNVFP